MVVLVVVDALGDCKPNWCYHWQDDILSSTDGWLKVQSGWWPIREPLNSDNSLVGSLGNFDFESLESCLCKRFRLLYYSRLYP
jgi:hypothetical protein